MSNVNINILYYHDIAQSVDDKTPPKCYSPTIEQFHRQMQWLKSRYNILSIDEVFDCFKVGKFPSKQSAAITFDDGLAGVMLAVDVLRELHIPATVFLSTRFIGTKELPWFILLDDILIKAQECKIILRLNGKEFNMANKIDVVIFRRRAKNLLLNQNYSGQMEMLSVWASEADLNLERNRQDFNTFLTWQQVEQLAKEGFSFGSHTLSHVDLRSLDDSELEDEFRKPVEIIREKMGDSNTRFVSYPDGRFDKRVLSVAGKYHKAGYATIVSSSWKDALRLPRFGVWKGDHKRLKYVLSWRSCFNRLTRRYVKLILGIRCDGM